MSVNRNFVRIDMASADGAQAPGNHNWFVVSPFGKRVHSLFECPKIPAKSRSSEFVVERGCAYGSLQHDVECRSNSLRFPKTSLPRLYVTRNFKVRRGETTEPGFRFRSSADRTLISNLPARARCGSGVRSDRSWMIMCFYFHHDMSRFFDNAVNLVSRIWEETCDDRPFNHRSIVGICRENPFPVNTAMGVADHLKQGLLLTRSVN